MNLSDLFKSEEDFQLEKRTLVILRWIAIFGQLIAVYTVYFALNFELPLFYCSTIILFGILTNLFLQFYFKKNQLSNLDSALFLLCDIFQLSLLLFFTGGIKNSFVIFLVVPSVISSTLLNLRSTFILSATTVIVLLILTFYHFPLPGSSDFDFYVPEYYLYAVPISVIVALVFLTYFAARFGTESRKRAKALNKLELTLAKEHELESIGHQAAAAVHSLGTPLSTITVIAKELKKEIRNDSKYSKDVNLLLSQAKRCSDILKKISENQIVDDKFMSDVSIQNLLIEITKSFEEISEKEILLNLEKAEESLIINRSPEMTYGIRNFIGNAVKYSNNKVEVNLEKSSNHIKINIIDDGPGFPEDVFKIIGQPYVISKSKDLSSKAGLGLGTFIGKTLLERKKATLTFSNLEQGGAIVTIAWKIDDLKI